MKSHPQQGLRRLGKALGYSLAGLRAAFASEAAFRQEVVVLIIAIPLALWLEPDGIGRALLIGSALLVAVVELLNSALEATLDRISTEQHPLVKKAKDMGSAAVPLTLPQFNGKVRLMATAWTADSVGHAEAALLVRAPVVLTSALPRFFAAGDQSRLSISARNVAAVAGGLYPETGDHRRPQHRCAADPPHPQRQRRGGVAADRHRNGCRAGNADHHPDRAQSPLNIC
jgi:diacylglycerol kinase (ATP)